MNDGEAEWNLARQVRSKWKCLNIWMESTKVR
jgi:hypothetical protein